MIHVVKRNLAILTAAMLLAGFVVPGASAASPHGGRPSGFVQGRLTALAAVQAVWTTGCLNPSATYRTCPVTLRASAQIAAIAGANRSAGGGSPLCRCNGNLPPTKFQRYFNNGRVAKIGALFLNPKTSPSGKTYGITFYVIHGPTGWLIDNNWCTNRLQTSLYSSLSPPAC